MHKDFILPGAGPKRSGSFLYLSGLVFNHRKPQIYFIENIVPRWSINISNLNCQLAGFGLFFRLEPQRHSGTKEHKELNSFYHSTRKYHREIHFVEWHKGLRCTELSYLRCEVLRLPDAVTQAFTGCKDR